MHVLAEAASWEAELQPQSQQQKQPPRRLAAKQQAVRYSAGKQPGPPVPRIHTLSKAQMAGVNQLTSKQAFAGQKILSQQNLLNHKAPQQKVIANTAVFQQKHQTIANLNVLKSSSLPNIPTTPNFPANSNVILAGKQLHQQANSPSVPSQLQRSQNASGARTPQQHVLLKLESTSRSHSQNVQSGSTMATSKLPNAKANQLQQQTLVQQPVHRNHLNAQAITMVHQHHHQQQQQQQQPGCIRNQPPQKPVPRNHTQKNTGIKTTLNTHINMMKATAQMTTINTSIAIAAQQKGSIKTLLPQQSGGVTAHTSNATSAVLHKVVNQPVKVQPQTTQQKQLIMNSSTATQYTQVVRTQPGQIKTLLPHSVAEPKRETELK